MTSLSDQKHYIKWGTLNHKENSYYTGFKKINLQRNLNMFLDAIASPRSYPCQWVSQWLIVSDLEIATASPSFASLFDWSFQFVKVNGFKVSWCLEYNPILRRELFHENLIWQFLLELHFPLFKKLHEDKLCLSNSNRDEIISVCGLTKIWWRNQLGCLLLTRNLTTASNRS